MGRTGTTQTQTQTLAAAAAAVAAAGAVVGSAVTYYTLLASSRRKTGKRSFAFGAGSSESSTPTTSTSRSLRGSQPQDDDGEPAKCLHVQRSAFALAKLASEGVVSAGFLSDVMAQLWPYIRVAGAAKIKAMMEPMFADMLPGPLKSTAFVKLDLGSVPIRFDNVVVHRLRRQDDDDGDGKGVLQFDFDVIWDGLCNIQLKSGMLNFGTREVKLSGRMSVLLTPLTPTLPVVSAIQYAFINPPDLELDFTGLAQVADFAIVDVTIRKMIQSILAGMMVLPHRKLYKMDLANDFLETYQPPLGVVKITAVKGRGFEIEKCLMGPDDVPDVYLNVTFGSHPKVWRTSTIWDDQSPEWNESAMFVLCDHDQDVRVHAWDEDRSPIDPDDDLGSARISVGEMLLRGGTAEIKLEDDTRPGEVAFVTLSAEVCDLTSDLSSFASPACRGEHKLCGVLTILATRAFDVPLEREEAASFVRVRYGTKEFFTGAVSDYPGIDALNPPFDRAFMVPLTADMVGGNTSNSSPNNNSSNNAKEKPVGEVEFSLMNGETVLGTTSITLASLAALPDATLTDRRSIGDGGASLEFRLCLQGIQVADAAAAEIDADANADASSNADATKVGSKRNKEADAAAPQAPQTPRDASIMSPGSFIRKAALIFDDDVNTNTNC